MNIKGKKYVKQLCDFGKSLLIYLIIQTFIFSPSIFLPPLSYAALVDETSSRLPEFQDNTYSFDTGDIDGDDDLDVVVANKGQSRVLINNGQGVFTDETGTSFPVLNDTTLGVALGDVDGDNDLDLVLANAFGPNRLLINNGSGVFADETSGRLPYLNQLSMDVIFHDLDSDDDLDLVIANCGSQNQIYINNGSGVFTDESLIRLEQDSDLTYSTAVSDTDGNGASDLLFVNKNGQNRLFLNDGLGIFSEVTATNLPQESGASLDAVFFDVEGDNDPDLFLTEGNKVKLLINDGNGVFTDDTSARIPAIEDFSIKALAGDMDFDGDEDLVVANAGQDRLLLNDGAGKFSDGTGSLLPLNDMRSFGLALFDADQDLDLDLLFATPEGQNRFLLNEIDFPRILITLSPDYIEVGDTVSIQTEVFDEDGIVSTDLKVILPDGSEQAVPLSGGGATFTTTMTGRHMAVVTAVDTHGAVGIRQAPFDVQESDITPPDVAINITAPSPLYVGHTVTIQVTATDDRSVDTLSLTINSQNIPLDLTGKAVYAPAAVGQYAVEATAADKAGNTGTATDTFTVEQDSEAPVVTLTVTPSTVDLVNPVTATVSASDNVRISSLVLQLSGPGITGHLVLALDENGQAAYTPYQPGTFTFEAIALDPSGNSGTDTAAFEAVGVPDTTAPTVSLDVNPIAVAIGDSVTLTVTAADDTGVAGTSLSINGTVIPLDASGVAVYTPPAVGDYSAVALAWDYTGNDSTDTVVFRVINPAADTTPPTVAITTPVDGEEVTAPTGIIGTAADENLVSYTLEYSPSGEDEFITLATGYTLVSDGVLAEFDPTMLVNGIYDVRLSAEDVAGQTTSTTVTYVVSRELKVGVNTITFTDLQVPVSGIDITINRTYDNRVKTKKDFGIGWTIAILDVNLRENRAPGSGWFVINTGGPFYPNWELRPSKVHIVIITYPDGKTDVFDMKAYFEDPVYRTGDSAYVEFEPREETTSTLQPLGSSFIIYQAGNVLNGNTFDTYNPNRYLLTTKEGVEMVINQTTGLESIEDTNGNAIYIDDNGIVHSSGKSIFFERDAEGRIKQIIDPMNNTLVYTYDENGDLISFTDRENNTSTFSYDDNHNLLDIINPLDEPLLRAEYDNEGRLIATRDADGNRISLDYDLDTYQSIVTDRLGNPSIYTYDEHGNVLSKMDALGNTTTYVYDNYDNLVSETDALGHTTTYTYDAQGNQLTQTDPLGNVTRNTYDGNGNLLTTTDPLGNVTQNTYDTRGNLLSRTAPDGTTTRFTYDAGGNPLTITDAVGNLNRFGYDSSGNPISQTDATGHVTSYTYDANGNRLTETTTYTTPEGVRTVTTRTEYNASNRVVKVIDAEGNVTLTEYDEAGQRVATVDALGRRTQFVYDERGLLTATIFPDDTPGNDADNPRTSSVYDAAGRKVTTINELGRETHFVFDAAGQLNETVYPDDTPTDLTDNPRAITEYDAAGQVTAQIDERGNRTEFVYDDAGRQTRVHDALGNENVTVYDAAGRQVTQVDVLVHTTSFTFDATGRLTTTTFTDGTSASTTFDDIGRVVERTDQAGRRTGYEYDAIGHLTAVVDALGQRTEYAYDEMGNLVRQTDANGHSTRYEYDALGRRVATVLPLGQRSTTTYDAVGNVTSTTDFNGQTMTYVYDVRNRLIEKHFADGSVEAFTYADNGLRTTTVDDRGTTTWNYDERDRLSSRIDPDDRTISYTYDDADNRTSVTIPSGTTTYTYDALNRLETVTDSDLNITTYHYDPVSNLVQTDFPNNTVETRSYDDLNRLRNLATTGPNGVFSSYEYQIDDVGHRTSVTEHDGRHMEYEYDALYRLVGEDIFGLGEVTPSRSIDYTYDPVGNRLSRDDTSEGLTTYTYDENDRLLFETLASDVTERRYDDNGNLLSQGKKSVNEAFYHWDQENRLVSVDTDADGTHDVINDYDADGIRVAQTVNGEGTFFLIDNNRPFAQVLEEYTPGGIIKVSYDHGLDLIYQNRSVDEINYEKTFYHVDGLGSTRVLTDSSGNVTDRYIYDAFGRTIMESGVMENHYLFAGEARDFNVGLDYLRARYLDTGSGRFVSVDPFPGANEIPMSLHGYLYASANPANHVDPSGLFNLINLSSALVIRATQIASRVAPYGARITFALNRLAFWALTQSTRVQVGLTIVGAAATFIDASASIILNNTAEVPQNSIGTWVERRIGANATSYEIIDDFRGGHATSIKTNAQNLARLLRAITKEAQTLAGKMKPTSSGFQPANTATGTLPAIRANTAGLIMVIPEINRDVRAATILSNPTFVSTVRQIAMQTQTVIRVIPLRRWIIRR